MIYTLKKIYKSAFYAYNNLRCFTKNYNAVQKKVNRINNQPKAFFFINDFNHGRYGYQLLNYINLSGYQVVLIGSKKFLYRLQGYDRLIFDIPDLFLCDKYTFSVNETDIGFTVNADTVALKKMGVVKIFNVNFDYFHNAYTQGNISMPYYLHPLMNQYLAKMKHVHGKRNGGILFYGAEKLLYSDTYALYFKKLSRDKLFKFLVSSGLEFLYPKSYEEFSAILDNNLQNKIVIYDDSVFRVPVENWLEVLSKFHFFLASPGQMPVSHNLLEAMSVGTVPIIQFSELMIPPLTDNLNCIVFNDQHHLIKKIEFALASKYSFKEKLSEGVFEYFNNHIAPVSFRNKIDNLDTGNYDLYINAEEYSLKYIKL